MIPTLDIIIVNWNSGELLGNCVKSINNSLNNKFQLNRIVIVDNASNDNSITKIGVTELPLTIINNSDNIGFAKACNQGAAGSEADYILFLNPDTSLFDDSLYVPLEFMEREENQDKGIVGVQILDEHKNVSRTCARFPSTFRMLYLSFGLNKISSKLFPGHFMSEWDHKESRIVDQLMGAFFLTRKSLFDKLGGFDERFFVYYEDLDFAYRASKNGFASYYLTAANIYHQGGGTTEQVKAERLFYLQRSKLQYAKKHFNIISYLLIVFTTFLFEPFMRILGSLLRGKFSEVMEIFKGYKKLIINF